MATPRRVGLNQGLSGSVSNAKCDGGEHSSALVWSLFASFVDPETSKRDRGNIAVPEEDARRECPDLRCAMLTYGSHHFVGFQLPYAQNTKKAA